MRYGLALLLLFGCADPLQPEITDLHSAPGPGIVAKGDTFSPVGTHCAPGCIWSGYAISAGAQEPSWDCAGVPCACVQDGNIWELCDPTPEPDDPVEPESSSPGEVPYFFQYNNNLFPGSSCQNTSVAMVLAHLGWSGRPDDITGSWGKDFAQRPHNLSYMFNTIAGEEGLSGALQTTTNGTLEDLRSTLQGGHVVIIHGYFTSYGHVLVVTGYDGEYYTVNDPAGAWRQEFRGGYPWSSDTAGHGIRYRKSPFEAAVATSDGYTTLPLWYHTLRIF